MRAKRDKVEVLLTTARGQLEAVFKMIDEDRYCMDIAMQLQAVESLARKARQEVVRAHMRGCVQQAFLSGDEQERDQKIDEIVRLLDKQ